MERAGDVAFDSDCEKTRVTWNTPRAANYESYNQPTARSLVIDARTRRPTRVFMDKKVQADCGPGQ